MMNRNARSEMIAVATGTLNHRCVRCAAAADATVTRRYPTRVAAMIDTRPCSSPTSCSPMVAAAYTPPTTIRTRLCQRRTPANVRELGAESKFTNAPGGHTPDETEFGDWQTTLAATATPYQRRAASNRCR